MAINVIGAGDIALVQSVTDDRFNALDVYQRVATISAIYPGKRTINGLAYVALKLNGEAGEVAEHVGKAFRDDEGLITPERRQALIKEIGDVLWYLSAMCNELDCNLSSVALKNIEKLADRSKRGKLQGSGDER